MHALRTTCQGHVYPLGAMALMHERLGLHRYVCNNLDAHSRGQSDKREEVSHGYHPHRGGRYDISEDRSLSPDLSRP